MQRSSSLTPFYKYFLLPLLVGVFLYIDISVWTRGDGLKYYWTHFAAPMSLWLIAWFVLFMLQLRRIQADDSALTIFSLFGNNKKVDYKDIEYVSEVALFSPSRIALKYRNSETGRSKKILVMSVPSAGMAHYIRQQITKHNPDYSTTREPSRWAMPRLAILTAIPFVVYGVIENFLTIWLVK